MLAVKNVPVNRVPGPDLFPAEIHESCPVLRGALAELFTRVLECNFAPTNLGRFYFAPLDTSGKDPWRCEKRRPFATFSPLMKLLELLLVRST